MSHASFESGSLRELWRCSAPLMLSYLATFTMLFVDRLCLANYSLVAHNAAVNAGMMAWTLTLGLQTLCEMGEIFVAQYNGAGQHKRLGTPAWQMLWVVLASLVISIPYALYAGPWLFDQDASGYAEKISYFRWMALFTPLSGMLGALMGFFIGTGKTRVITAVAVVGNLVNCVLDPILIFGIEGWVPSYGVAGAAVATGIGIGIQVAILAYCFLSKKNRREYGTDQWMLQPAQLWGYIKVTLPSALMVVLEIGGWAMYYALMSGISDRHILIAGISQDFIILMLFFGVGLHKGVSAIAGNLIGAGKFECVHSLVKRASLLSGAFALSCAVIFALYPDPWLNLFLEHAYSSGELQSLGDWTSLSTVAFYSLLLCCLYLFFDQTRMVVGGVLGAAGDTKFLLGSSVVAVWLFLLIPTYYLVVLPEASVEMSVGIWCVYAMLHSLMEYWRYRGSAWSKKDLLAV